MTNIIVGLDGSSSSRDALRWAQREGELRKASVTAVLAWGLLDQHHPNNDQPFDPDYHQQDARNALDAYVSEAVGEGSDVRLAPINDLPARALLTASHEAQLLVVGGRGLGGFRGLLLGSVSYQVLHHATCPIAIVRAMPDAQPDHVERIVVGVDGSDNAVAALDWAIEEARLRDATLEVVHAWNISYAGAGSWGATAVDPMLFEAPANAALARTMERVENALLSRPAKGTLICGGAGRALIDAAADADLLVTGARGTGGFAGLLLGSTTTQVVHHSPCPVVVVPARDRT